MNHVCIEIDSWLPWLPLPWWRWHVRSVAVVTKQQSDHHESRHQRGTSAERLVRQRRKLCQLLRVPARGRHRACRLRL